MDKLAICVLTANRPDTLMESLGNVASVTKRLGIPIYIFDGTPDGGLESERIVRFFNKEGYNHIFLDEYRYYGIEDGLVNVNKRINRIFIETKADYILMTGDKAFLREEYYSEILEIIDKEFPDIICGYSSYKYSVFNNPVKFLKKCMVGLTWFGRVIIRKEIMKRNIPSIEDMNLNLAFNIQNGYLKAIDKKDFKGVSMYMKTSDMLFQVDSGSYHRMWNTWIKNWGRWMELLPSRYDGIKEYLYGVMDRETGFFSEDELIRQRAEGQFDLQTVEENEELVKRIIQLDIDKVRKIACCSDEEIKKLYNEIKKRENNKFFYHYKVLYVWMRRKSKGGRIENFFDEYTYKSVLIYGAGYLGELLCYDLEATNIEVRGFIDKKETQGFGGIPVFKPSDCIPKADVVITTVPYYDKEIKEDMEERVDIPIHTLTEMINYMIPKC